MTCENAKSPRVRATTIHDVAAAAGVAPMTASRALNGNGYVRVEMRERVLEGATAQLSPERSGASIVNGSGLRRFAGYLDGMR